MELDCLDLLDAEVEDRLGDEDQRLLEQVQPACLGLHVGFDAGLARSGLEVVSGLDEVEAGSGVDQLDEDLELRTRVLRLQFLEIGIIVLRLRTDLGLNVDLDLLLDLDDDIPIHGLSLIDGLVLVELQYNRHLRLVGHGQDEASGDVFVLDGVVEGHAVEPDVLLVEVYGVLASWD